MRQIICGETADLNIQMNYPDVIKQLIFVAALSSAAGIGLGTVISLMWSWINHKLHQE
mgnify:FL=1